MQHNTNQNPNRNFQVFYTKGQADPKILRKAKEIEDKIILKEKNKFEKHTQSDYKLNYKLQKAK